MPSYHPPEALVMAYAAGVLEEPVALFVATHLALCPVCRENVQLAESAAGALMATLEPVALGEGLIDQVMGQLGEIEDLPKPVPVGSYVLPQPLRGYTEGDIAELHWRKKAPGIREFRLPLLLGGMPMRVVEMKPGFYIPKHGHNGLELLMVLTGSLDDAKGHYERGDVASADESVVHDQRVGRQESCVALVLNDGPISPRGPYAWILSKVVGI